ncbi:hypothetical protein WME98_19210 [Sorangium sp. So ce296]|uniref:hypothetical protein n=1 Tax=Sorangium sp. So ce296 TaxID=3133296 RepID=UPI003F62C796
MIARERIKPLLGEAERLADSLRRYRAPGSDDPVDPSRLAELHRYLRMVRDVQQLGGFLNLLPTSFHAKMSKSARPQLLEIAKQVRPLLERVSDPDELLYVLGWAQRLLVTEERRTGLGVDASGAERSDDQGMGSST